MLYVWWLLCCDATWQHGNIATAVVATCHACCCTSSAWMAIYSSSYMKTLHLLDLLQYCPQSLCGCVSKLLSTVLLLCQLFCQLFPQNSCVKTVVNSCQNCCGTVCSVVPAQGYGSSGGDRQAIRSYPAALLAAVAHAATAGSRAGARQCLGLVGSSQVRDSLLLLLSKFGLLASYLPAAIHGCRAEHVCSGTGGLRGVQRRAGEPVSGGGCCGVRPSRARRRQVRRDACHIACRLCRPGLPITTLHCGLSDPGGGGPATSGRP